jgi:thiol-disulfide isomerase/thioredoxin
MTRTLAENLVVLIVTGLLVVAIAVAFGGCNQPDWPMDWPDATLVPTPEPKPVPPKPKPRPRPKPPVPKPISFDLPKIDWQATAVSLRNAYHVAAAKVANEKPIVGRVRYLVVYTADDCPACADMEPVFQKIKADGWQIVVANIDDPPAWTEGYRPKAVPQIIVGEDGKNVREWYGAVPYDDLKKALLGDPDTPPRQPVTHNGPLSPAAESHGERTTEKQAGNGKTNAGCPGGKCSRR